MPPSNAPPVLLRGEGPDDGRTWPRQQQGSPVAAATPAPAAEAEAEARDKADPGDIVEPDDALQASDCREIIRHFQCPVCGGIFKEQRPPVVLPCGNTACRECIPLPRPRRPGEFPCPMPDCGREHTLGECAIDVTSRKMVQRGLDILSAARALRATGWGVSGFLVHFITRADAGMAYHADAADPSSRDASATLGADDEAERVVADGKLLAQLREEMRPEADCQVCYAILLRPLTTGCGHTFCSECLPRAMDHARICPICRRPLHTTQTSYLPALNVALDRLLTALWPVATEARRRLLAAEQRERYGAFQMPIFVCTLSFPSTPTFLHVFEPRYRLMMRRAMSGDRTFGMVLHRSATMGDSGRDDPPPFMELGTVLKIKNLEYFPDGRSLVETVGLWRFRVRDHSVMDGYYVANIQPLEDISAAEEEALEASETTPPGGTTTVPYAPNITAIVADGADTHGPGPSSSPHVVSPTPSLLTNSTSSLSLPASTAGAPAAGPTQAPALDSLPTPTELDRMSTRDLHAFAADFVRRMRSRSVSWLTQRMVAIYGECPEDPERFVWWFASLLPIKEEEKYGMLGTSSIRERMKMCCRWIVDWEQRRW